nr:extensin-3-like [Penaeus vannamei]
MLTPRVMDVTGFENNSMHTLSSPSIMQPIFSRPLTIYRDEPLEPLQNICNGRVNVTGAPKDKTVNVTGAPKDKTPPTCTPLSEPSPSKPRDHSGPQWRAQHESLSIGIRAAFPVDDCQVPKPKSHMTCQEGRGYVTSSRTPPGLYTMFCWPGICQHNTPDEQNHRSPPCALGPSRYIKYNTGVCHTRVTSESYTYVRGNLCGFCLVNTVDRRHRNPTTCLSHPPHDLSPPPTTVSPPTTCLHLPTTCLHSHDLSPPPRPVSTSTCLHLPRPVSPPTTCLHLLTNLSPPPTTCLHLPRPVSTSDLSPPPDLTTLSPPSHDPLPRPVSTSHDLSPPPTTCPHDLSPPPTTCLHLPRPVSTSHDLSPPPTTCLHTCPPPPPVVSPPPTTCLHLLTSNGRIKNCSRKAQPNPLSSFALV